jgi:hypothetical protein
MATLPIKDLPLNKEMDSTDMAVIEGGFTIPSVLKAVPIKLIVAPQPVTRPNNGDYFGDGGGGNINPANDGPDGDDDLHQP